MRTTSWRAAGLLVIVCLVGCTGGSKQPESMSGEDAPSQDLGSDPGSEGDPSPPPEEDPSDEVRAELNGEEDAEDDEPGPRFDPLVPVGAEIHEPVRGRVVQRGTIHLHTGYSHDACDGEVWMKNADPAEADGERILQVPGTSHLLVVEAFEACNRDVRQAVCDVAQDFLFHTDHNANFPSFEYPDVLLYRPDLGDELIERDGAPSAMWLRCADGRRVMMSAGVDTHLLAFGLERHVVEDMAERRRIYGSKTEEAVELLREAGALVVSGYSDEWDVDLLFALPFDGFEIYNPATNLRRNLNATIALVAQMIRRPDDAPHPQFALLPIFEENEENLTRWSTLAELRPIFNYLGTNAHQNVFKTPLVRGERVDSFRRLMSWFANYVLVPEGQERYDDRDYKAALGAGLHYGVFEYLGVARGFDYHGRRGDDVYEMGSRVSLEEGPVTLHVRIPEFYGRLPRGERAPEVWARVLRAEEGAWTEVARGEDDFSVTVEQPGVYRVDVRMVPHHLRPWLGTRAEEYIREVVWVYSNPIFVGVHL